MKKMLLISLALFLLFLLGLQVVAGGVNYLLEREVARVLGLTLFEDTLTVTVFNKNFSFELSGVRRVLNKFAGTCSSWTREIADKLWEFISVSVRTADNLMGGLKGYFWEKVVGNYK